MDGGATRRVWGIDGCPAGWIGVCVDLNDPGGSPRTAIFKGFDQVLEESGRSDVIAIDVPIGLVSSGRRECDQEARKRLGKFQRCVFDAPIRPVLGLDSPKEALSKLRELNGAEATLNPRAFGFWKRVAEVDSAFAGRVRNFHEVHPELCFWAMNDKRLLRYPKRSPAGFIERLTLLSSGFIGCKSLLDLFKRIDSAKVAVDDILDACAAAWTARRIAEGKADCIPPKPGVAPDVRGLRMEMWF